MNHSKTESLRSRREEDALGEGAQVELEHLVRCWLASEAYIGGDTHSVGPNHRPSERRRCPPSVAPAPNPVGRVALVRLRRRAGSLPPRRVATALR